MTFESKYTQVHARAAGPRKQKGAALFVSLIFLLILAVLGISSMNDTIMQGKMASAIQDGNLALQGAETALRSAEQAIENLLTTTGFDNSAHLYTAGNAPDPFAAATWVGTSSVAAGAVANQAAQPRYFIELAGTVVDTAGGANTGGMQEITNIGAGGSNVGDITTFRIVVRGTGGTTNSQRVLESYYGKRLP